MNTFHLICNAQLRTYTLTTSSRLVKVENKQSRQKSFRVYQRCFLLEREIRSVEQGITSVPLPLCAISVYLTSFPDAYNSSYHHRWVR